jgi:hypothetical protein
LEAAEFVCRDAVGVCDAAEVCADHVDGLCPEDDKLGEETECRMSVDVCDPAEVCDGVDNDCPADVDFVDSDGDGACDGSEPETKNDPTKVMLEDPMVTVEILSGCAQLLDFAFLDEMDLSPEDEYYEYPLGLVTFALPCASAEIKITFAEAPADLGDGNFLYRVYDPDTMTYETLPGVVMMGNMVFLSLVDGGPGDTGTVEVATMGTAPDGMIAHTGGPSYSIGPVQAPALSFGALVIAVGVLMGIVWPRMRRRRGGRL